MLEKVTAEVKSWLAETWLMAWMAGSHNGWVDAPWLADWWLYG